VNSNGYYESLYISPAPDDLVADLALAFLQDDSLRLGRGDAPDMLLLSFSAQDVVSHSYGNESEEELDVLRRLDLHLGRLLAALERLDPARSIVVALSADHGFLVIPEAERKRDKSFVGGRLVNSDRTKPNFLDRLNVFLDDELCLDPAARPVYASEGWNLMYARGALPLKTIEGKCGAPGRPVTAADVDNALVDVIGRFYKQEIQEVLLVSQRDRWLATDPATEFARNDFDSERSGDAFLVPRPGVIMHWDPARGSGHGSHYDYDTHVPLIFWGAAFRPAESPEDTTPYDLAPTVADLLGIALPDAVGRSRVPSAPPGRAGGGTRGAAPR
jgi:arylsulfatase A-like enzyme